MKAYTQIVLTDKQIEKAEAIIKEARYYCEEFNSIVEKEYSFLFFHWITKSRKESEDEPPWGVGILQWSGETERTAYKKEWFHDFRKIINSYKKSENNTCLLDQHSVNLLTKSGILRG